MRQLASTKDGPAESVDGNAVSPGYLQTMGIRIIRGRPIAQSDTEGMENATVVSASLAGRYWPGEDPLERIVYMVRGQQRVPFRVVGICQDGKYREIQEATRPFFHVSLDQHGFYPNLSLLAAPNGPVNRMLADIRAEIGRSDGVVVLRTRSIGSYADEKLTRHRLAWQLMALTGAVALLLTLVGIASSTAHVVLRRQSEIGVRMAVGATSASVIRMVVVKGCGVVGVGLLIGSALAATSGRLLTTLLFGVRPAEPIVLVLVGLGVMVVGAAACPVPSLAIRRIDPVRVIRADYTGAHLS
jgi:hypothetical protein